MDRTSVGSYAICYCLSSTEYLPGFYDSHSTGPYWRMVPNKLSDLTLPRKIQVVYVIVVVTAVMLNAIVRTIAGHKVHGYQPVNQNVVGPSTPAECYSLVTVPIKARCKQTIKTKTLHSTMRTNSVVGKLLDVCPQFFFLPQAPDFLSTRPYSSFLFLL